MSRHGQLEKVWRRELTKTTLDAAGPAAHNLAKLFVRIILTFLVYQGWSRGGMARGAKGAHVWFSAHDICALAC
jgi:hypothetical protein